MICKTAFGTYEVTAFKTQYRNNNSLAVQLLDEDGSPFGMLTVNLPETRELKDNEQFVDVNNCPWAPEFIRGNALGEPTGRMGQSGFCSYPLYAFDLNKLKAN